MFIDSPSLGSDWSENRLSLHHHWNTLQIDAAGFQIPERDASLTIHPARKAENPGCEIQLVVFLPIKRESRIAKSHLANSAFNARFHLLMRSPRRGQNHLGTDLIGNNELAKICKLGLGNSKVPQLFLNKKFLSTLPRTVCRGAPLSLPFKATSSEGL